MLKGYAVTIGNGWQVELIVDSKNIESEPACYLTFHSAVYGEIVVKECLFRTILDDVPQDVRTRARRAVAAHRDELEATWQYNKNIISDQMV